MIDVVAVDAAQAADEARLAAHGACWAAAGWYADHGLPVFPVAAKLPLTAHGFKDASTDQDQIDAWWQRWPEAGVAAPTGVLYDVVDVDGPVGYRSLASMSIDDIPAREYLFPVLLGVVLTRRGHHYLIPPSGNGNAAGIHPGIDFRGVGGYTVLPPSKIDGEVGWRWATEPTFGAADA